MTAADPFYAAAEQRIERLTLAIGVVAVPVVAIQWGWRAAAGWAVGAVLAWVNYRWLKQGIATLTGLAVANEPAPKTPVPKRVYAKLFARYALLGVVIYVSLSSSLVSATAVLAGLFSLVAATLTELIYELVRGDRQASAG